jgi:hypothetical protein
VRYAICRTGAGYRRPQNGAREARSTTRQELVKRLLPPAAHLSPITLMVLTHPLFQLFLSPFCRLRAFHGCPLMANLRDSTSALSNMIALIFSVTNLTGNYARSFEGEPSSFKGPIFDAVIPFFDSKISPKLPLLWCSIP